MNEEQIKQYKEVMDEFAAAALTAEEPTDTSSTSGYVESIERMALKSALVAFQTWLSCRAVSKLVRAAQERTG